MREKEPLVLIPLSQDSAPVPVVVWCAPAQFQVTVSPTLMLTGSGEKKLFPNVMDVDVGADVDGVPASVSADSTHMSIE